jgi:hypothetical protein
MIAYEVLFISGRQPLPVVAYRWGEHHRCHQKSATLLSRLLSWADCRQAYRLGQINLLVLEKFFQ